MDGDEATRLIRKLDKDVPIIALSAIADKSVQARYLEIGYTHYLTKPYGLEVLVDLVSPYL